MASLRGGRLKQGQTGEDVGGGQFEPELVAGTAQAASVAAGTDRLDPAEYLFDLPALTLAAVVAGMPDRATLDRAAPPALDLGDVWCHHQAEAVLGQQMAVVAEPGLPLGSLPVEPHLGFGRRLVRLAAAAFTFEVARTVAAAAQGRLLAAGKIALVRSPSLQQRAVDAPRAPPPLAGSGRHRIPGAAPGSS